VCDEWLRIRLIAYTTGLSVGRTLERVTSVGTYGISLTSRIRNSMRLMQPELQQLFDVKKLITIPEGNPKN
jgi:hypothetical protein